MSKLFNRCQFFLNFYRRRVKLSNLPVELVIEATNQCNLNCLMCTRQQMTRPVGYIKMGLYRKVIDEAASFLELVYLHGLGEPLFHPKIGLMIRYAKSKGLKVGLSTNATLLTKEKSRELINSGLDYLIIALDAVTAKTYEQVRGGKNFNQVVKNVKDYLKLKKEADKTPFTVIQFVKLAENEKEVTRFKKMWIGSGAEVVRIKPVIDLLRQHKQRNKSVRRPCFYLWRQLNMVSWDGKFITPCCMDTDGDYPLGDINKQSLTAIWNGKPMQKLRQAQIDGSWRRLSLCKGCSYPQPSFLGRLGVTVFSGLQVKKILPFLERVSFGKFHVYD